VDTHLCSFWRRACPTATRHKSKHQGCGCGSTQWHAGVVAYHVHRRCGCAVGVQDSRGGVDDMTWAAGESATACCKQRHLTSRAWPAGLQNPTGLHPASTSRHMLVVEELWRSRSSATSPLSTTQGSSQHLLIRQHGFATLSRGYGTCTPTHTTPPTQLHHGSSQLPAPSSQSARAAPNWDRATCQP
jgi:hypothetical protein